MKKPCIFCLFFGAQLGNALSPRFWIGASPSGKAAVFGTAIRWFESSRPSHLVTGLTRAENFMI
jgi:hypothetical protein